LFDEQGQPGHQGPALKFHQKTPSAPRLLHPGRSTPRRGRLLRSRDVLPQGISEKEQPSGPRQAVTRSEEVRRSEIGAIYQVTHHNLTEKIGTEGDAKNFNAFAGSP